MRLSIKTVACIAVSVAVVSLAGCSQSSNFEQAYDDYISSYDTSFGDLGTYKKFLTDDRLITSSMTMSMQGGDYQGSMSIESSSRVDQEGDEMVGAESDIAIAIAGSNAQVPGMSYAVDGQIGYRLIDESIYLILEQMDMQGPGTELYAPMIQQFVGTRMYSDVFNEAFCEYQKESGDLASSKSVETFMDTIKIVTNRKFLEEDTTRTATQERIPVKIRSEIARKIEQNIIKMLGEQLSDEEREEVAIADFLIGQEFDLVRQSDGNVTLEGEVSEEGDTMKLSLHGEKSTLTVTSSDAMMAIEASKVSDTVQNIRMSVQQPDAQEELFVGEGVLTFDMSKKSWDMNLDMDMTIMIPGVIAPGLPSMITGTLGFDQRMTLQSVDTPQVPDNAQEFTGLDEAFTEALQGLEEETEI